MTRKELLREPCVYCQGQSETLDHITPRSRGGSSKWDNKAPACYSCNHSRGNLPLLKWLLVLSYKRKAAPLTRLQRREMGLMDCFDLKGDTS